MPVANGQISITENPGFFDLLKKHFDILLELGKVRITFFVSITTLVGSILYAESISWIMFFPAFGVFLLACGSSALNHFQERKTDALMERTKRRPLPSRRISELYAIIAAASFVVGGSALIYFSSNLTSLVIGIITLFWYNVIYTPLKRKYVLAVVPGSLIGALPPVIGYTAVGGSPFDIQILFLALFFFIWQIPHFWLLLMIYGSDYSKAGFPTLTKIFNTLQLGRITFVWIAALATSSLFILSFDVSSSMFSFVALVLLGAWLLFDTKKILTRNLEKVVFWKTFFSVNIYVLAIVIVISIDKLFLKVI
jgi:protoheme IX farnesyltransferase